MSDPFSRRAPATPLVVHDPFLSVWSPADELTDAWSCHWTGRIQGMCGMVFIDGAARRFLGRTTRMADPVPVMEQKACTILPTRTIYVFEAGGVELTLTFLSPALPDDLPVMARPLTYVAFDVKSLDGAGHDVSIYFDVSATWTVDQVEREVIWGRHRQEAVESLWIGSSDQPILARGGDEIFIDWGYLHLSPSPRRPASGGVGDGLTLRSTFARSGHIPNRDNLRAGRDLAMPARASGGMVRELDGTPNDRPPLVVAAWSANLGTVTTEGTGWHVAVAYDQIFAIEYFHRRLRPFWRREFPSPIAMIAGAWEELDSIRNRCGQFDKELTSDLLKTGGETFARLAVLAYRQCLGGHVLVADEDGTLLYFSKENSSNGCMGTVDLTYPSAPFFLLFNPALLEAQMRPICDYAASPRWPFPFAPHDIGRFPLANGQIYGGGELEDLNQMPFEECGNMLILASALAEAQGSPAFAKRYWSVFAEWAGYLEAKGHDPEEQLCTDDFDGHMSHNVNLSAKAIVAIGAFAKLCGQIGRDDLAVHFRELAERWVDIWLRDCDDGEKSRMTFDQPGTWSQKYNIVWDRLLGLDLFPAGFVEREMAFYRGNLERYGLPLHGKKAYTKLDWLIWTACLTDDRDDMEALIRPIGTWLDETPDRVPLSDWFDTRSGTLTRANGFRSRPVVGGVFIPVLFDREITKKWSTRS